MDLRYRTRIYSYNLSLVREPSSKGLPAIKLKRTPDTLLAINHFLSASTDRENFGVLWLNTRNVIIGHELSSVGILNGTYVHPREIFAGAILAKAAAIIAFHNHPSGDTEPSQDDLSVTNRLRDAGRILGIELLDHVIVATDTGETFNRYTSMKDRGIL